MADPFIYSELHFCTHKHFKSLCSYTGHEVQYLAQHEMGEPGDQNTNPTVNGCSSETSELHESVTFWNLEVFDM